VIKGQSCLPNTEPRSSPERGLRLATSFPSAGLLGWEGKEQQMNGIIYLVGLVVIVMFILSFFGLR
jgi:hypothetical protein